MISESTEAVRGRREPTSWTMPLRWVTVAYLALNAIYWIVTTALYVNAPALERVHRVQRPDLSDQTLHDSATLGVALGWAVVVVLVVISLVLAVGSLRGWRWAFWAVLAWWFVSGLGVVTNLVALANPAAQTQPQWATVGFLLLAAVAVALLLWFLAAAIRFGPWAMRKPSA
jgi:hypothetical protein